MTAELIRRPPQSSLIGYDQLIADLRSLGLCWGQDLLIHCSLRKVGPVDGGAATLLGALRVVAGPGATLVVPTETSLNSLTSRAFLAATAGLDADERTAYVATMPGFDPATTPSDEMGAFAEYVRTRPASRRSSHPQVSFAALGPKAGDCTSVHDLNCHLGERSPLRWLYDADAAILLLGVGYAACTAFHLAEYRLPWRRPQTYSCFIAEEGRRVKHEFTGIVLDDSVFDLLGQAMESGASLGRAPGLRLGRVGSAAARLVPVRTAVDFAGSWLADRRGDDIS
jgi:aminoglycoside 3-N-acetyltransferase